MMTATPMLFKISWKREIYTKYALKATRDLTLQSYDDDGYYINVSQHFEDKDSKSKMLNFLLICNIVTNERVNAFFVCQRRPFRSSLHSQKALTKLMRFYCVTSKKNSS